MWKDDLLREIVKNGSTDVIPLPDDWKDLLINALKFDKTEYCGNCYSCKPSASGGFYCNDAPGFFGLREVQEDWWCPRWEVRPWTSP
jgi:hypothetical protein